jgi:hypothetical protein
VFTFVHGDPHGRPPLSAAWAIEDLSAFVVKDSDQSCPVFESDLQREFA